VHQADWKLIRVFHGGQDGSHRWKLFNLSEDIGEKHDLAAREPQQVKKLDALIDRFLADTRAVVPVPNPDFDPAAYRPEDEGRPDPRRPARPGPPANRSGPPQQPVAGWKPSRDCRLATIAARPANGQQVGEPVPLLKITSTGGDPYLSYALPQPLPAGRFQIQITMSSTTAGRGQLFWQEQGVQPPFFRDRSTSFAMTHDGQPHEYRIASMAARPVTALRLDPGRAAGEIRISAMKLLDAEGTLVYEWNFAAGPPARSRK
jgi:hypothetical protein